MPWGQPGERLEPGCRPEPLGAAHGGDQQRRADLGDAGQAAGQLVGLDLAVGPLAGPLVDLLLGQHSAQQADLGGQLGGQLGVGHGGVVAVQGDRGLGDPDPPASACLGRGRGESPARRQQLGDAVGAGVQQRAGVAVALQHGQVGDAQLAGEHVVEGGNSWRARSRMRIL